MWLPLCSSVSHLQPVVWCLCGSICSFMYVVNEYYSTTLRHFITFNFNHKQDHKQINDNTPNHIMTSMSRVSTKVSVTGSSWRTKIFHCFNIQLLSFRYVEEWIVDLLPCLKCTILHYKVLQRQPDSPQPTIKIVVFVILVLILK